MRTSIKLVLTFLLSTIFLKNGFSASNEHNHEFKFPKSNITETVKVFLPEAYNESKSTYPVLYTTAGTRRLNMMAPMLDWLTHVDWSPIPQLIIVTVPTINEGIEMFKDDGASGKFDKATTQWLGETLIPFINDKYRTQPFRILEGFSSYGNFPLYVYQHQPELFQSYISLSPALVLNKNKLVASFKTTKNESNYKHKSLYVSLGSFEENAPLFQNLKSHLQTRQQERSLTFIDNHDEFYLQPPVTSLTQALTALFSDRTPSQSQLADLYKQHGVNAIDDYFQSLSKKYGARVSSAAAIETLAAHFTDQKNKHSIQLLKLLIERKPDNIYYKVRLADAFQSFSMQPEAKAMLKTAIKQAKSQKNEEAIAYLNSKLSGFEQQ
ncbi:hypothetical protein JQC92_19570 [Shewanella sp. 202IG2-18]|uniref:alpha/beta hydrolase-fold protein n=1 Tax=Parashewanella hymeniacidonis TaxID=2807618 RepID=UPI00195F4008|nr:alpha/beta hydrolase-fold protein [Parashewanella hymeniacidonis]MBM7074199.1 hypothetical protein [Parashewanella hymeniacidonis]